ncbi:MAG: DUF1015 domain-containing protein [Firmicutes bacterium]|nr:DUF1015 domain-containing protein [Bacillota bacterium]
MALIKPFRALRPARELAAQIAALPYDVVNSKEAREMVRDNKYSFLRIDRGEINFPEQVDPRDPRVYQKAAEIFQKAVAHKHFIQDQTNNFYIYRQIMEGRAQTGLVAAASIDDYTQDIIKKHEFTLREKEQDRIDHIQALNAQSGPIFQTYRDNPEITEIIDKWAQNQEPEYQFEAHGVEHIIWVLDSPEMIRKITGLFAKIDYLYIADGHHRSAAAVRVGLQKRKDNPNYGADDHFNFFLSVLFPASDLKIWPYNRVVKDLAGYSEEEFLEKIQERFTVEPAPQSPYEPAAKRAFGMYLADKWYKLSPKPGIFDENDPVKSLDAAILQDHLLDPVLNIKDPRKEERIDFVGGIRGVQELERRIKEDMKVAFSIYPTSVQDVIRVADSGRVMPPKSTWFEPKLLSGLFIHKL